VEKQQNQTRDTASNDLSNSIVCDHAVDGRFFRRSTDVRRNLPFDTAACGR